MTDTSNRISVISTILGRMDRNIDGNTATGFDGEDENLIVDFADSTFNRVFLFFYIPDQTDSLIDRVPTRFMTGWANFAELAERTYWFGANSSPSHLWPMYSAEDSLSPGDSNIYLGDWLQGSAGTFWAGQQHYITECQNIFRGQMPWFIQNVIPTYSTSWNNSVTITGDAFFKYGLNVLDSLRNQDRFPNFYTRPACNQNRIAHSTHELKGYENEKPQSDNSSCIMLTSNEDFLQFRLGQEKQSVISSADGKTFYLQEMDFNTFSSGIYFVNSSSSHQIFVIVK